MNSSGSTYRHSYANDSVIAESVGRKNTFCYRRITLWAVVFFGMFGVMMHNTLYAQITVSDNIDLHSLVKNLEGPGLTFSNITSDCNGGVYNPYGFYEDKNQVTGLNAGLLLTTGAARHANGPNDTGGKGEQNNFLPELEPDLSRLMHPMIEGVFYDVCKVEFDVSVYSDTLRFNYVFASEEYIEFVGDFHDVFGFFISGPGIQDTLNIALVPGTNEPVSVSTINHLANSNYFVNNGSGTIPPYSKIMQYDGYTDVLEAKVKVVPCETYHIKLVIADEGDGIYDSGIFLESGSFRGTEKKITSSLEFERFGTALEGCNDGFFHFHRVGVEKSNLSQPVGIKYDLTGTAVNGIDYTLVEDSITIPPFEDSVSLRIEALADLVSDPFEYVKVSITNHCPALPTKFTDSIPIQEQFYFPPLFDSVCEGSELMLNEPVQTLGFELLWDSNESLSCVECLSPTILADKEMTFGFSVTDPESGCSTQSSYHVDLNPLPDVFFTYHNNSEYTNLDFFFDNETVNATSFEWNFGDGMSSTEVHPFHTFEQPGNEEDIEFTVTLTGTNGQTGCVDSHTETIKIATPFFLPNIITPNNDLTNDEFKVTGIQPNIWKFRVYNRWGKIVHRDDRYNNRWGGGDVPDGTYFFDLINPNEDKYFKGFLQIMR